MIKPTLREYNLISGWINDLRLALERQRDMAAEVHGNTITEVDWSDPEAVSRYKRDWRRRKQCQTNSNAPAGTLEGGDRDAAD